MICASVCTVPPVDVLYRVPLDDRDVRYADDPEADYFLIRELTPGFLDGISGTYKDPEGYFVCEKDPEGFERFEATFPKKEKRKLSREILLRTKRLAALRRM